MPCIFKVAKANVTAKRLKLSLKRTGLPLYCFIYVSWGRLVQPALYKLHGTLQMSTHRSLPSPINIVKFSQRYDIQEKGGNISL